MSINTVISGSYRKHFREMLYVKEFLTKAGIHVLAPVSDVVTNPGDEFALLDADPIHDPRTLEDSIFAMLRQSSFLVVLNKDGYLGNAAIFEMGYAASLGLQILSIERVGDPNLAGYCRDIREVFPAWKGLPPGS